LQDWVQDSALTQSFEQLKRERFLSGPIFQRPSLSNYDWYWLINPQVFLSDEIKKDPINYLKDAGCSFATALPNSKILLQDLEDQLSYQETPENADESKKNPNSDPNPQTEGNEPPEMEGKKPERKLLQEPEPEQGDVKEGDSQENAEEGIKTEEEKKLQKEEEQLEAMISLEQQDDRTIDGQETNTKLIEGTKVLFEIYKGYLEEQQIDPALTEKEKEENVAIIQKIEDWFEEESAFFDSRPSTVVFEIGRFDFWRNSSWMGAFNYLDATNKFFKSDWGSNYVRSFAIPLLSPNFENLCELPADLSRFSYRNPPEEAIIERLMSLPSDRCSAPLNNMSSGTQGSKSEKEEDENEETEGKESNENKNSDKDIERKENGIINEAKQEQSQENNQEGSENSLQDY